MFGGDYGIVRFALVGGGCDRRAHVPAVPVRDPEGVLARDVRPLIGIVVGTRMYVLNSFSFHLSNRSSKFDDPVHV